MLKRSLRATVVCWLCFWASALAAQVSAEEDSVLAELTARVARLRTIDVPPLYHGVPASSAFVPSAYGGRWGSIGVGLQFTQMQRFTDRPDGAVGIGIPLGNPERLGVDVGVAILDIRPEKGGTGGFGQRGSFNLKVHRLLRSNTAVSAGLENILNWGGTDAPVSIYVVGTQRIELRENSTVLTRMYLSGGFGHGRFGPLYSAGIDFGGFWSVSADLHRFVEGFVEWSGQDFGAGISVAIHGQLPVVITPALIDLAGSTGTRGRFYIAVASALPLP
jgi:hypothetical protein